MARWLTTCFALALASAGPVPVLAQDIGEEISALEREVGEAYSLGYDRKGEINARLVALAEKGEKMLADAPEDLDNDTRLDLLSLIGQAYFGAAQHYDSDWGSEEDLVDRAWLIKAEEALRPVMEARGHEGTPAYDYRGASGQLWDHARYYALPDIEEYSARRVQGNRYMLARDPDDEFERRVLAESLYQHGWQTKDDALIAEADAIFDSFPDDDKPYQLVAAREAIAEGRAPYAKAGEVFW